MIAYSAPLLRLPIRVEVDRLQAEATQFPPHLWYPDRLSADDPTGYTSLALVSHRGRANDLMFGPFAPTTALAACPYIRQLLSWFDAPVGEVRLRWLGPRGSGSFHFDWHFLLCDRVRVHIPIVSTPHATFVCGDDVVEMPEGSAWTFDRMRCHGVFNDDPTLGRLHLVMDFTVSGKLRELMQRSSTTREHARPDLPYQLLSFEAGAEPRVVFESERAGAVWSPARVASALDEIRTRFADDRPFAAMAATTKAFLARWTTAWDRHADRESGWPRYLKLARSYYRAWRDRFPMDALTDDRSETSWVACLLQTGAYDPTRTIRAPSWLPDESLRLTDTLHVALDVEGRARVLAGEQRHQPLSPAGLLALAKIARGATPGQIRETVGDQGLDQSLPTLRWLARDEALRPADAPHDLDLLSDPAEESSNAASQFPVPASVLARLRSICPDLARARFQPREELHFLIHPAGNVMAYVPGARGYVRLFPGALALAQHMALGQPLAQVAQATGYRLTDNFLVSVAWLWDLLPFTCEGDDSWRRPIFAHRLEAGEAVSLPTLYQSDAGQAIDSMAGIGACAVVLDSLVHGSGALRIALGRARLRHVDVLVKTSRRARLADLLDLPVAGLVVADCDERSLAQLQAALAGGKAREPFVIAVIETVAGLRSVDAIAASPLVHALVVGPHGLAMGAGLRGANPAAVIAQAEARVRLLAARHHKVWAVVDNGDVEARRAHARGARLFIGRTDETIFSTAVRPRRRATSAKLRRPQVAWR